MIFGKKRSLPIAEVEGMLTSGTPEEAIKSKLKQDGFSDDEVSKCIEQARVKVGVVAPQQYQQEAMPWEAVPQEQAAEFGQEQQYAQQPQPQQQSVAQEEFQMLLQTAIENLKNEMEQKLQELEGRLERVGELEDKLQTIISSLEEMKGKYSVLIDKSDQFAKYEDELGEVKGNVNSVLQILKTTLPPVIKTLQEIKEQKPAPKKSDVEHLL